MLRKVKLCLRHPALRRYLVLLPGVMINRRPYATDLSDARWALIEPVLSAWRAGCAGPRLPPASPPYQSVYGYCAAREKDGTTAAIRDLLRRRVREQAGRAGEPAAALLDAQSVKTSGTPPDLAGHRRRESCRVGSYAGPAGWLLRSRRLAGVSVPDRPA